MKVERFLAGEYRTNCYIVFDEVSMESLVFDPGEKIDKVIQAIEDNNYDVKYIFITHGHFDHTTDAMRLKGITKAPIVMSKLDLPFNENIKIDIELYDGMEFNISGINIKCIATPGHTMGGFCFLLNEELVISGDTIFKGTIGRTDFPGGDFDTLINSISNKIFTLDDNITIFPGHGNKTSVGLEKVSNTFFI